MSFSNRGGSSAGGFVAILAVAVVGGGLYLASRQLPEPRAVVKDDSLAQVAALARAEKDAEWIQRAIREHQAILGMTARETETAKGRPSTKLRGGSLTADERTKGGIEKWVFQTDGRESSEVLFGANGLVISSSDVGDKPGPGQVVRQ